MANDTLLVPSRYPEFMGDHHPERPLPAGSIVDNCGILGTVIHDDGTDVIEVEWKDTQQQVRREEWEWILADQVCLVVSVNKAKPVIKP